MCKTNRNGKRLQKAIKSGILSDDELTAISQFGIRIRKLRRDAEITQESLAGKMGITTSAVNKYESDDGVIPSTEALLLLSKLFHVTTDYLLLGIKSSPPSVSNTINSDEVTNSSVVQMGNGSQVSAVRNMSAEAEVLLKNFESLNFEKQMKVLTYALTLKDSQGDATP